jgi:hypothetical protein
VVRPSRTNASIARARGVRRLPTPDCASGASAVAPLGSQAIAHACRPRFGGASRARRAGPLPAIFIYQAPSGGPCTPAGMHQSSGRWSGPSALAFTGVKQRQVWTEGGPTARQWRLIQPAEALVACATRQATAARLQIGIALPQSRQSGGVHVEAPNHVVHAACLTFDTPSHERSHSWSSPASPNATSLPVARPSTGRWSPSSGNRSPCRPAHRRVPSRIRLSRNLVFLRLL